MKDLGCVGIIILLAWCVVLSMAWAAVATGAVCAWFLSMPFDTGWHLAWAKPWVLLGWSILFTSGSGIAAKSTSK